MAVMGFTKFERFFREAAQVRVDRDDVKRYLDFVNDVIYDVLLIGQATAKANARDIIEPWDPPITAGLQECMHQFERIDEDIELRPILDSLAARPPLASALSEETPGPAAAALRRDQRCPGPDVPRSRRRAHSGAHRGMGSRIQRRPDTHLRSWQHLPAILRRAPRRSIRAQRRDVPRRHDAAGEDH